MRILIDTSVLLRFFNPNDPRHFPVRKHVWDRLNKDELCVAPQCIYEFMVVATRPLEDGGFGKSTDELRSAYEGITQTFLCQPDPHGLMDAWFDLVMTHRVMGKTVHDARLIAYMKCLGIGSILTLNASDFKRYGVTVLSPEFAS